MATLFPTIITIVHTLKRRRACMFFDQNVLSEFSGWLFGPSNPDSWTYIFFHLISTPPFLLLIHPTISSRTTQPAFPVRAFHIPDNTQTEIRNIKYNKHHTINETKRNQPPPKRYLACSQPMYPCISGSPRSHPFHSASIFLNLKIQFNNTDVYNQNWRNRIGGGLSCAPVCAFVWVSMAETFSQIDIHLCCFCRIPQRTLLIFSFEQIWLYILCEKWTNCRQNEFFRKKKCKVCNGASVQRTAHRSICGYEPSINGLIIGNLCLTFSRCLFSASCFSLFFSFRWYNENVDLYQDMTSCRKV